jgi:hypothetical protein
MFPSVVFAAATPSPTPFPDYTGNPDLITPGVAGFVAIFAIALITVLLIVDMTRRIRRSRYREEVRIKLEQEQVAAAEVAAAAARKAGRGTRAVAPTDDQTTPPELGS